MSDVIFLGAEDWHARALATGRDDHGSTDHLARLLLQGEGPGGAYTPFGFELTGSGHEVGLDRMNHLHEAHHAVLNDATSWGTALHILARLGPADLFQSRLDQCRQVHESFATIASVLLLQTHHEDVRSWLAARYPSYWRLILSLDPLLSDSGGPIRQYLLAIQLARVCMQTPILDTVQDSGPTTEAPLAMDVPDRRWAWLLRHAGRLVPTVAREADAAARLRPDGTVALSRDTNEGADPADIPLFDEVWTTWETTVYDHLAAALRAAGAVVLGFDGHQDPTASAIAWAERRSPSVGLAASAPRRGLETAFESAIVTQSRLVIAQGGRWCARWLPPGSPLEPMAIRGQPLLVLDARTPGRLMELFGWEPTWVAPIPDGPVVAVRTVDIEDDRPVVEHLALPTTRDARELLDTWGDLSRPISCVSASCLVDEAWTSEWVPLLRARTSLFVLVDVDPRLLLPNWRKARATAIHIRIADTAGRRDCLLIASEPGSPRWLIVSDELGVRTMQRAMEDGGGVAVALADQDSSVDSDVRAILTHLLATESFYDLGGLTQRQPHSTRGAF